MTFHKDKIILEQNIKSFTFLTIMMSYIDEFSQIRSHGMPNSISSD